MQVPQIQVHKVFMQDEETQPIAGSKRKIADIIPTPILQASNFKIKKAKTLPINTFCKIVFNCRDGKIKVLIERSIENTISEEKKVYDFETVSKRSMELFLILSSNQTPNSDENTVDLINLYSIGENFNEQRIMEFALNSLHQNFIRHPNTILEALQFIHLSLKEKQNHLKIFIEMFCLQEEFLNKTFEANQYEEFLLSLPEADCFKITSQALLYLQIDSAIGKGIELLCFAAEQGYAPALYWLADCYNKGKGVNSDLIKSAELLQQSANQEFPRALCELGNLYASGCSAIGIDIDLDKAVDYYRRASTLRFSLAQFYLGECYQFGQGVCLDLDEAIKWFKLASSQYCKYAQLKLGQFLYQGIGLCQDYEEAAKLFQLASDQDCMLAHLLLSKCYSKGHGVEINSKKAAELLIRASAQGCEEAQYLLAICYLDGNGVEKDPIQAAQLLTEAKEKEFEPAEAYYSDILRSAENKTSTTPFDLFMEATKASDSGFAKAFLGCFYLDNDNLQEAIPWLAAGCEQQNAFAQTLLGSCYMNGWGIQEDKAKAISLYKNACTQEAPSGYYNLGKSYKIGNSVPRNIEKAKEFYKLGIQKQSRPAMYAYAKILWNEDENHEEAVRLMTKASELEFEEAQCWLGIAYVNGEGVRKNLNKGIELLKKAVFKRNTNAQYHLGKCFYYGEGLETNYREAFRLFKLAANQGDDDAQYCVGICYEEGHGVPKNLNKAIKWWTLASNQNNVKARFMLATYHLKEAKSEENLSKAQQLFQETSMLGNTFAGQVAQWLDNLEDGENSYQIGICFAQGREFEKDPEQAFKWLAFAAQRKHSQATIKMAYCYQMGFGVDKNREKAFEWFSQASQLGALEAKYHLAQYYLNGWAVEQDIKQAEELLQAASEVQHPDTHKLLEYVKKYKDPQALFNLYSFYKDKRDKDTALNWLTMACQAGLAKAQFVLAHLYLNGEFREKNIDKAFELFKLAREQKFGNAHLFCQWLQEIENPNSLYQIGRWYSKSRKHKKAVIWWEKASLQENCDAQFRLGKYFLKGKKVDKSLGKGLEYLEKAASQGHQKAQCLLGRYLIDTSHLEKGVKILLAASQTKHAKAQFFMGDYYENKASTKNIKEARHWYRLARNNGYTKAQGKLPSFVEEYFSWFNGFFSK